MSATDYVLDDDEIRDLTGYSRPHYQMRVLSELGIPAKRRPDNSLIVMRMHCLHPVAQKTDNAPKLKSSRK